MPHITAMSPGKELAQASDVSLAKKAAGGRRQRQRLAAAARYALAATESRPHDETCPCSCSCPCSASNRNDTAGAARTICDGKAGTAVAAMDSNQIDIAGAAGVDVCFDMAGTAITHSAIVSLQSQMESLMERLGRLECFEHAAVVSKSLEYSEHSISATEALAEVDKIGPPSACRNLVPGGATETSDHDDACDELVASYEFLILHDAPKVEGDSSDTVSPGCSPPESRAQPCVAEGLGDDVNGLRSLVESVLPPILSPFMESIVGMMGVTIHERFDLIKGMVEELREHTQHQVDKQKVQLASLARSIAELKSKK